MDTQVDIQMPIKAGSFIIGDVIQRLLAQDVPFTFYADAGEDLEISSDHEDLLALVATSARDVNRIKQAARVAFKRNRLRTRGDSPYVYLADTDVLLPESPFFRSMIRAFERNPQLGAAGLCYQESDHVASGSMMLRRADFIDIGELRGAGKSCVCTYMQMKLQESSLAVVPLTKTRARHLKSQYSEGYPEYEAVQYQVSSDSVLPRRFLENTIEEYGTRFKLFVHN
ncbi:MAG: hypothetical protein O7E52_17710 [Candidatus Poribacteria bacterium]|nr:hypothetical protein [Candidatus Poribacteria bacterium]